MPAKAMAKRKKPGQKPAQVGPNRRTMLQLLRELGSISWRDGPKQIREARALVNEREALLMKDSLLHRLLARSRKLEAVWKKKQEARQLRINRLRQELFAFGPTPGVTRRIQKLVLDVHAEDARLDCD